MALTQEDLLAIGNLLETKLAPIKTDVADLKDDVGSIKETVHRNYDVTLEFYGKQQEFNTATQEKLDELHSLIVIFSQQTIKNTTDLRLIK